jgi:hypothetical protein
LSFLQTAFDRGDYQRRLLDHYYPCSRGNGPIDVEIVD